MGDKDKDIQIDKKEALIDQGRMLKPKDVLKMWPVSRGFLIKISTDKNDRLPSYKFGKKRYYKYDEILWYWEKHKVS